MGLIWSIFSSINQQKNNFISLVIFNNLHIHHHIDIIDSTGNSNLDLPPRFFNSTTVDKPITSLPNLLIKLATQLTVPPVAKRSSTIT